MHKKILCQFLWNAQSYIIIPDYLQLIAFIAYCPYALRPASTSKIILARMYHSMLSSFHKTREWLVGRYCKLSPCRGNYMHTYLENFSRMLRPNTSTVFGWNIQPTIITVFNLNYRVGVGISLGYKLSILMYHFKKIYCTLYFIESTENEVVIGKDFSFSAKLVIINNISWRRKLVMFFVSMSK